MRLRISTPTVQVTPVSRPVSVNAACLGVGYLLRPICSPFPVVCFFAWMCRPDEVALRARGGRLPAQRDLPKPGPGSAVPVGSVRASLGSWCGPIPASDAHDPWPLRHAPGPPRRRAAGGGRGRRRARRRTPARRGPGGRGGNRREGESGSGALGPPDGGGRRSAGQGAPAGGPVPVPSRSKSPSRACPGRRGPRRQPPPACGRRRTARLGSARLGSARLGSARLGSARLGSARLGSARLGLIRRSNSQPATLLRAYGHLPPGGARRRRVAFRCTDLQRRLELHRRFRKTLEEAQNPRKSCHLGGIESPPGTRSGRLEKGEQGERRLPPADRSAGRQRRGRASTARTWRTSSTCPDTPSFR